MPCSINRSLAQQSVDRKTSELTALQHTIQIV